MSAIIARKASPTSDFCSIFRGNALRAYDALRITQGDAQPHLRLRGEREWSLYELQETAKTLPVSADRFLSVRLRKEKHEPCTELTVDPESPALVGWSAYRFAMLARDPSMALWRVHSAWRVHFTGFELARVEMPDGLPQGMLGRQVPVEIVQGGPIVLYLEHYSTGLVRFEMP